MTPTASKASGFLSLNNGETVENRGLRFPFADSSPKMVTNSLNSCFVSVFAADFTTSIQERRDVLGVNVGAEMFRGISGAGGNSEKGIASAGSDVDGSLGGVYIQPKAHVAARGSYRGVGSTWCPSTTSWAGIWDA